MKLNRKTLLKISDAYKWLGKFIERLNLSKLLFRLSDKAYNKALTRL